MTKYCLVLGIDASGKTTFLHNLPSSLGFTIFEPAESKTAQKFREDTFRLDITPELIEKRRNMFLELNIEYEKNILSDINFGKRVATSGGSLVTNISHDVMFNYVNGTPQDVDVAVKNWLNDKTLAKPGTVIFLHADESIIKERNDIRAAQDILETQIGFYSPESLSLYQKAWSDVVKILRRRADMRVVNYDSGALSPSSIVNRFTHFIS